MDVYIYIDTTYTIPILAFGAEAYGKSLAARVFNKNDDEGTDTDAKLVLDQQKHILISKVRRSKLLVHMTNL